jgi:hypothetical protein
MLVTFKCRRKSYLDLVLKVFSLPRSATTTVITFLLLPLILSRVLTVLLYLHKSYQVELRYFTLSLTILLISLPLPFRVLTPPFQFLKLVGLLCQHKSYQVECFILIFSSTAYTLPNLAL